MCVYKYCINICLRYSYHTVVLFLDCYLFRYMNVVYGFTDVCIVDNGMKYRALNYGSFLGFKEIPYTMTPLKGTLHFLQSDCLRMSGWTMSSFPCLK